MDRLAVRKRYHSKVSSEFSNIAPPSNATIPLSFQVFRESQHGLDPLQLEVGPAPEYDLLEVPGRLHPRRLSRRDFVELTEPPRPETYCRAFAAEN